MVAIRTALIKAMCILTLSCLVSACGGEDDSGNSPTTITVEVVNLQPVALIATMAGSGIYLPSDNISFSGEATDPEEGVLSNNALQWRSSRDGSLGTGSAINSQLSIGAHTISFTATDSKGLTNTDFVTIFINDVNNVGSNNRPSVAISSPNQGDSLTVNSLITLTGQSSDLEDGEIPSLGLLWLSSIDGSLGSGNSLSVTLSLGTHLISLQVQDSDGLENIANLALTVTAEINGNTPPYAYPGNPQSIAIGDTVLLDASQSFDQESPELTYRWSFESKPVDSQAVIDSINSMTPSYVADKAGDYVAKLIVNDGQLNSSPVTVKASTYNFSPIAYAGIDQLVLVGSTSQLNGSASTDVENSDLSYLWSFVEKPANSDAVLDDVVNVMPSFTPDKSGTYHLALVVSDGSSFSVPDEIRIIAGNVKPIANIQTVLPNNLFIGSTVTFDGQMSFDANGDVITYQWQIINQPNGSIATLSNNTGMAPTLITDKTGNYTVALIVSDFEFASVEASVEIFVANQTSVFEGIGFEENTISGFTGDWERVTTKANSGSFSLQPPEMAMAGTAIAELVYNTPHTQISFRHYGSVDFYIDDVFYASYSGFWSNPVIIVSEGSHTYRWQVTRSSSGRTGTYLDDIQFSHTLPVANTQGPYSFDEGFLSQEFSGDWDIDNGIANSGSYSLRAPYMATSGTSSTELVYNNLHTQISFRHYGSVDFYIDDVFYASYSGFWSNPVIIVPEGSHTYRWQVTRSSSGRTGTYLDDIQFSHTLPVSNAQGPYSFDEGFLSQEFSGDWDIDNGKANSGSYSLRAPYMATPGTSSTELVYNNLHTQISFRHYGSVDFYIDDVFYASYSGFWSNPVIIVPEGSHTYRWQVTRSSSGRTGTYLDDIQFSHTIPVSNAQGPYSFDDGFLSQEFSGDWDIDNYRSNSGSYSLRAPYMATPGTSSTELVYNKPHTQISFRNYGSVDFYIDDVFYASYSGSWSERVISVNEGSHTYRWLVTRSSSGRSNVNIDDIVFE